MLRIQKRLNVPALWNFERNFLSVNLVVEIRIPER